MPFFRALAALFALALAPQLAAQDAGQSQDLPPEALDWLSQLDPQSGTVTIEGARATLDLGEDYIFYGAGDSRIILTEAWGNPPETVTHVLGMVMPAGTTPLDDSWGAVISFEDVGYVEDDDAADVDYDELLELLQEGTEEGNAARMEQGYGTIDLVGWAARPEYDRSTHSVVWAQNLKFSDAEGPNTLNYDVRTLGRYGVLSVNLVAGMDQLDSVRTAADALATHARFDQGARYADFNAATDNVAEYGVGGLIAASAGMAAAKKMGFFAILLKFIKPIGIGILLLGAAFRKKIGRLFGFKSDEDYEAEWDEYEAQESEDHMVQAPADEPMAYEAGQQRSV